MVRDLLHYGMTHWRAGSNRSEAARRCHNLNQLHLSSTAELLRDGASGRGMHNRQNLIEMGWQEVCRRKSPVYVGRI